METAYRLTIHVGLELADEPAPIEDWDDEPDRVEVETKALKALKDDPDLQTVLFQLRSLYEAEFFIQEFREELEQDLSAFNLGEKRVAAVLKAVATNDYEAQLLVEATKAGFLEEIEPHLR